MKMEHKINQLNERIRELELQRADEIAFHKRVLTRPSMNLQEVKEMSDKRLGVITKNGKK